MVKRHKILVALLAASMISGTSVPVSMAADTEGSTSTNDTIEVESLQGGGKESVDVTITVTENNGETTTDVKTSPEGDVTESGANVKYEGSSVTTDGTTESESAYLVDGDGYGASGGTEVTVTTGNGSEGDISMDLIKDGTVQEGVSGNSGTAGSETTGDLKEDNAAEYDQTTVTTTDRTASVDVEKVEVSTGDTVYLDDEGNPVDKKTAAENGYHYYWSDIYTVDGKSIIDGEVPSGYWTTGKVIGYKVDAEGNKTEIHKEGVCQRVVAHDNGTPDDYSDDYEVGGLYCVDMSTGIQESLKYRRANLEDADYYSAEDILHLRAILTYGYTWDTDQDGDNGYTTLENMKAMLREAKENGDEATKELLKDFDIDSLTREQAATATGMAIWTYGNRVELAEGESILYQSRDGNSAVAARINTLYQYLITLTKEADEKETQIINEEKFIADMEMIIGAMVNEHENNLDDDDTNDAYNVDLKFSLEVNQVGDTDDLIVKVVDAQGNVIKVARIAGDQKEGEDFGYATKMTDENGNIYYVLEGLELIENSNQTFNLKIEGIQVLEEGVYIFESQQLTAEEWIDQSIKYWKNQGYFEEILKEFESEDEKELITKLYEFIQKKPSVLRSQNFIGCFEGETEIDANMAVTFTFDVDEATITTEHTWREEWVDIEEIITPDDDIEIEEDVLDPIVNNNSGTTPTYTTYDTSSRLYTNLVATQQTTTVGDLVEIEDEEVPLAATPKTGSLASLGFLLASLGSGIGLFAVEKEDKKRKK